jgi:hypothetical protein
MGLAVGWICRRKPKAGGMGSMVKESSISMTARTDNIGLELSW